MQELIQSFDFGGQGIRVIRNEQDQIFFVAKDVCEILGYNKASSTIIQTHCKPEGVTKMVIPSNGGEQEQFLINEGNLYRLVLKSKKKEAERFESWVCDEVLPQIRKTGRYEIQPKTQMEILADAVLVAQNVITQKDQQIKALAPKAEFTDKVLQSQDTYPVTAIAKEVGMSAAELNKKLCERGVQYKFNGTYVLYARYQAKGFTKSRTHIFEDSDGMTRTTTYTVWTEYGRAFIPRSSTKTCRLAERVCKRSNWPRFISCTGKPIKSANRWGCNPAIC